MFRLFGNPAPQELPLRLYPTTIRFPVWARPLSIRTALTRLSISEPKVRRISERFELERGLARSFYKPDFRPTLNPAELIESVRSEAPVDGTEIVEWMQVSGAEMAVLCARIQEYNALGSELTGNATDPYYPGLVVEDCKIRSESGSTIRSRGYGIGDTPRGSFNVPFNSKSPGVFKDLITWGSISATGSHQWNASLLKWKSLAETPISKTVGFYRDYRGNLAPQFFVQQPPRPALTVTVRQRFSSDQNQTLKLNFRDPTDYSRIVGSKSVAIASGESEVTYTVSAFPYVPPTIAEIQPEDATQIKLESYAVA
jgi:hypothetical protein